MLPGLFCFGQSPVVYIVEFLYLIVLNGLVHNDQGLQ